MYILLSFVYNSNMAYFFDVILLTIIIFIIAYILLSFVAMPFAMQLVTSMLTTFVIVGSICKIFFRDKKHAMSYRNFITYLIWQGEDYTKTLLSDVTDSKNIEDKGEYLLTDDTAVFLWTKYGRLSADTLVRLYRICAKDGIKKAKILTTNSDKKSLSFVKRFGDVVITFESFKPLYRKLKSLNRLPQVQNQKVNRIQLLSLIFESAFTRRNGFRFVAVSLLLVAISLVTPFSDYYLILASINLILAITCLIRSFIK